MQLTMAQRSILRIVSAPQNISNSEPAIKAAGPIDVRSERSLDQEPVV